MEVICLEDAAFYALIDRVVERVKENLNVQEKWIGHDEAMKLLHIKSKVTLQELRDNGEIRFSQPRKKIIAYDRASIDEYFERNARETF